MRPEKNMPVPLFRQRTTCQHHSISANFLVTSRSLSKSVFLLSNEERSVSSESTPMFPVLETEKLRAARERCRLLQHGCPSLYFFFLFLSIKFQIQVCAASLFRKAMRGYYGESLGVPGFGEACRKITNKNQNYLICQVYLT